MTKHILNIQLLNQGYQSIIGWGDILWQSQRVDNSSDPEGTSKIPNSIPKISVATDLSRYIRLTNFEENLATDDEMKFFLQLASTREISIEQTLQLNPLAQFSFSDKILLQLPYAHFAENKKKILIKSEKIAGFSIGCEGKFLRVFTTNLHLMIDGLDEIKTWIPGIIEQIYVKTKDGYQLKKILTTNRALLSFVCGELTSDLFSSNSFDLDQDFNELQKRLQIGFIEDSEIIIKLLDKKLLLIENYDQEELMALLKELFECLNSYNEDGMVLQRKIEFMQEQLSRVFDHLEKKSDFFSNTNYRLKESIKIICFILRQEVNEISKIKFLLPAIQNEVTYIMTFALPFLIEYQKYDYFDFFPKNLIMQKENEYNDFIVLNTNKTNFKKNKLFYYQFSQYCEITFKTIDIATYFSIIDCVKKSLTVTSNMPYKIAELALEGKTKKDLVKKQVTLIKETTENKNVKIFIEKYYNIFTKQVYSSTKPYNDYFSFTEKEIANFSKISNENILLVADQLIEAKISSLARKTKKMDHYSCTHFRYYYNQELLNILKKRQFAKIVYLDSAIVNKIPTLNNKHYQYEMLIATFKVSVTLGTFLATAALTIALLQTSTVIFPAVIVLNNIVMSTQHLAMALAGVTMAVELFSVKQTIQDMHQVSKSYFCAEKNYFFKHKNDAKLANIEQSVKSDILEVSSMLLLPDQQTLAPVW